MLRQRGGGGIPPGRGFAAADGGSAPWSLFAGGSPSRLRVQRYGDFSIPPNFSASFFAFRAKKGGKGRVWGGKGRERRGKGGGKGRDGAGEGREAGRGKGAGWRGEEGRDGRGGGAGGGRAAGRLTDGCRRTAAANKTLNAAPNTQGKERGTARARTLLYKRAAGKQKGGSREAAGRRRGGSREAAGRREEAAGRRQGGGGEGAGRERGGARRRGPAEERRVQRLGAVSPQSWASRGCRYDGAQRCLRGWYRFDMLPCNLRAGNRQIP